jgi:alkylation response protein AidB-like acyl-CoA dehydrogenase
MSTGLPEKWLGNSFGGWLDERANGLDTGEEAADSVLTGLASAGLPHIGVPKEFGGDDGALIDAVTAIAEVSARSLAAGFVLWGHRTYIEYLLQSPNTRLRDELLPSLLDGSVAGATGLSNAMKFLQGLEELQFQAQPSGERLSLTGKLPWVTNLRGPSFQVAVAVSLREGPSFIASLSPDDIGVTRSADLDLIGLRSTNTAAIGVVEAKIESNRVIHQDAMAWLPQVRPAFLGLQCAMSIGLARRSLLEARNASGGKSSVLSDPIVELSEALDHQIQALSDGLRKNVFYGDAAALFRIRIRLADIVANAVSLELQASGGRAYLASPKNGFARRWREAAFIPIITPSVVQLKAALAQKSAAAA